ncbi:MAG: hypothetical protein LBU27_01900 [Candidatus Peribacteria bacterium]|jgi:hypothetical protein|nr:hypothetical protein [Candidatus Peribacteria bacterium]
MQEISPNPEWDGKTFRLVEDGRGGKTPTIFSETENIFEPYFSEAFLAWSKQKERIMTLQVN